MKLTNFLFALTSVMGLTTTGYCAGHSPCWPPSMTAQTTTISQALVTHGRPESDSLKVYAGRYALSPTEELTISVSAGTLYILAPGQPTKAELKQLNDAEFEVVGEAARLLFRKDEAGKVIEVDVRFGNGASAKAKKL